MGHAPSKILQISACFKFIVPLLTMSHGNGVLVALVVKRADVPGSNIIWRDLIWRIILYDWQRFNTIWLVL
jgi:hypothetical protein